jgi:hypothetical protein
MENKMITYPGEFIQDIRIREVRYMKNSEYVDGRPIVEVKRNGKWREVDVIRTYIDNPEKKDPSE